MFMGTYHPKLDDKGRIFLPAKFRESLQGGLVMTKGQEHSLYVFPREAFEAYAQQLQAAPLSSKSARDYIRMLHSGASDEIPDRQGRVTIPAALRTYAGLTKECVVIGSGSRVEIWDGQRWDDYLTANEPAYAELAEEVVPGVM